MVVLLQIALIDSGNLKFFPRLLIGILLKELLKELLDEVLDEALPNCQINLRCDLFKWSFCFKLSLEILRIFLTLDWSPVQNAIEWAVKRDVARIAIRAANQFMVRSIAFSIARLTIQVFSLKHFGQR